MKNWNEFYEAYNNIKITKSYKTNEILKMCIPTDEEL